MKPASDTIQVVPALVDGLRYPFRNRQPLYAILRVGGAIVTVLLIAMGLFLFLFYTTIGSWFAGVYMMNGTLLNELQSSTIFAMTFCVALFFGYIIKIVQASMRGDETPPPYTHALKQIRVALEASVIWICFVYLSDLLLGFARTFLFGDLAPADLSQLTALIEKLPFATDLVSVILLNANQLILFYVMPLLIGSYAQRERLADMLPLSRLKKILTSKNYVKLGIVSTSIWYLSSRASIWISQITYNINDGLEMPMVAIVLGVSAIIISNLVYPVLPLLFTARLTGSYWHTIESNRAGRMLLVNTTKQQKLVSVHDRTIQTHTAPSAGVAKLLNKTARVRNRLTKRYRERGTKVITHRDSTLPPSSDGDDYRRS